MGSGGSFSLLVKAKPFCLSGRRRRISLSCERLRGLLPHFDGRREDMASVLEMTVYFLQLAHSMAPGWEHLSVSCKQVGPVKPLQWICCVIALFRGSIFLASLGSLRQPKLTTSSAPS